MIARRSRLGVRSLAAAAVLLISTLARAVDFPVLKPPPAMFRAHRERFLSKLPPNSIAILHATPLKTMSNDVEYLYRQDSDFWYLTGIEEPDVVAIFRPGAPEGERYVVFVPRRDPRAESYEGPKVGPREAPAAYGADAAFSADDLLERLARYDPASRSYSGYLAGVEKLYLSDGGDAEWADKVREALGEMRAREAGPSTVVDAREVIHEMRVVKDADEIALIRRATEISARAHTLAMKAAAPGKYEFEIQHALDSYCHANGARRMAYPSIVASGPNSVYLHWDRNDRKIEDGDVILNDSGAEYGYYATDITRTYPASGRFRPEQRAIYEIVLAAQKAAMAEVKPGVPHDRVGRASARVQVEGLIRLGLLKGDPAKIVDDDSQRVFTKHGISHWVGLDVHDAGRYLVGGKSRVMEPGMVFTIEPGIYIPANAPGVDRKWWNIGVRVEDVVLVTPSGFECLSCSSPREIADVEATVQSGR
ncbi:MAG TPA: aminopeptidase P N-terminal domain-containing protein [Thermoanaerobaculia bacterium]